MGKNSFELYTLYYIITTTSTPNTDIGLGNELEISKTWSQWHLIFFTAFKIVILKRFKTYQILILQSVINKHEL